MTYLCTITHGNGLHEGTFKTVINASSNLEAKILLLHWLVEWPSLKECDRIKFLVEKVESV